MTPELWEKPGLWERLKPVFEEAMDKPEPERARFIEEVSGKDSELREALQRLVNASGDSTVPVSDRLFDLHQLFPEHKRAFAEGELVLKRFRIVRLIGSGGMGEVYEAVDLELGRIALKTIRPDIAGNPKMLAHFKKEVELAQKILNPHVCRIHHYQPPESADRRLPAFLTMEFLEGATLADRIRESGPLPWKEVKAIALEICEGLRAMHEADIIHRDLKSRNVMLANRNGAIRAVIMDFGLAREVTTATSQTASEIPEEQGVAGTVEYMAPEQFEGQRLTPAADVFALGVVMYEMATGKHPFPSRTILQAAVQRGRKPPAPSSIQKKLPHRCDEIVGRCLEFDPKKRYGSASIVAEEIEGTRLRKIWVRAVAAVLAVFVLISGLMLVPPIRERVQGILFSSREKHIAVLPFEVTGNDPQTQALGDGLMDSLAGKLSNLDSVNQSLWVVPASEVRSRKVKDAQAAQREFGATIVVQGDFERSGAAAHLRLTLIDPQKMREIGFADVENATGDLATLEDAAVTSLGRLMNVPVSANLTRDPRAPVGRAAYEDYLAGVGYFQRYDKAGNIERAIEALQKAVTTDPEFALAFAQLAQVYVMRFHLESNPEWLRQAEAYGREAARLNDRLPSTYVALAQLHELTGNRNLAIEEYQRALDLDPRNPEALIGTARAYEDSGRNAEAEAAYIKAAALRPGDWSGYNALGVFYDQIGRQQDAIVQFRHALDLAPDNAGLYSNLGLAYFNTGDTKLLTEAEKMFRKSNELSPNYVAYANLASLYILTRQFRDSIHASNEANKLIKDQSYEVWMSLASAYDWLGDRVNANIAREKALDLLQEGVKRNPQDAERQATLALIFAKKGLRSRALQQVQISLALSPNNEYVLWQIGDTYEQLGDRKSAIGYLQRALKCGLPSEQLNGDPDLRNIIADPGFRTPKK